MKGQNGFSIMEELPILDIDNEPRKHAAFAWLRCYLCFPDDVREAEALASLMFDELERQQNLSQKGFSNIAQQANKRLIKRANQGRLHGQVYRQMLNRFEEDGKIEFRKAVWVVAELAQQKRNQYGEILIADEATLRKQFKNYKNVVHFWAAFDSLSVGEQKKVFTQSCDVELLSKFLILAAIFQLRGEKIAWPEVGGMHHWRPFSVPAVYRDFVMKYDLSANSFNETLKVTETLREYKKSL